MAHQGAKIGDAKERKEFFEWIEELEHKIYTIPRANLTIYLHVPIEISQELIRTRAKESKGFKSEADLHEVDTGYLKRVQDTYTDLANRDSNWCTIECTKNNQIKSREEIAEEIWNTVITRIDK
jgi:dTMP kinase